jgi:hypothetical protein
MEINKNLQLEINQVSVFLLAFLKKNLFQWKPYFIFVPSNFTDDSDASDDEESETGSDMSDSCICSSKSNNHMIMITTAPLIKLTATI